MATCKDTMTIIGNIGGSKNKISSGWSTELSQGRIGMSASSIIRIERIIYKINGKKEFAMVIVIVTAVQADCVNRVHLT